MLMFREEKSPDDEIKAWQFWHSRQHSVKQRILDAGKWMQEVKNNRFANKHNECVKAGKLLLAGTGMSRRMKWWELGA